MQGNVSIRAISVNRDSNLFRLPTQHWDLLASLESFKMVGGDGFEPSVYLTSRIYSPLPSPTRYTRPLYRESRIISLPSYRSTLSPRDYA